MTAAIEREARRENLAAFLDLARDACARAGLGDAESHDVRLVAEEVCANVIAHGYAGREPGPLSLAIDVGGDDVVVRVEDRAPVFDPLRATAPDCDEGWDTRPIGGLGLHLVRQVAREVRHEARDGGGNRVTVVIRRGGTSGRPATP